MLAAERRARILSRAQQDGAVRITALVDDLGVSHVTIRRDLDSLVADQILEKVRGGAMLRADRPLPGQSSTLPFTGAIGVVMPTSYYYRYVVEGIDDVLASGGEMKLVISEYDLEEEYRLIDELVASGVAGLLWVPTVSERVAPPGFLDMLARLPVPVVFVERETPGGGLGSAPSVRSAHERGVFAALQHLANLGHRRLLMVSRGSSQSSEFARSGWRDALERLGLDPGSSILGPDELGAGPRWDRGAADVVLDAVERTGATALFCHGDENSLFGLLQNARSRGLAVPEKLSIVAYDDDVSAHADPPISAVAPDRRRVGALATRMLLDLIREPSAEPPLHLHVEPRLVLRASTAPPA
ncbi:substrate-binding domain-containing protein [Microbacterium sp. cx-55]|uniref:substrate-binding domain-containing protein n=1 Tax=Microbacterium sp. cx-55 TaxID=2875948 RepID=UPI001CC1B63F|nr:substrate-binding domain-containing protein [Microbacterium sp. cx-55]MBZ4487493.1 substrate-binding domain-containing protein [Microbacterium sp. cx-55]UGB35513.1 substrate-binding domain-containing protein [Microbacterium sp. cx-55]